jgi:hypothetical protein
MPRPLPIPQERRLLRGGGVAGFGSGATGAAADGNDRALGGILFRVFVLLLQSFWKHRLWLLRPLVHGKTVEKHRRPSNKADNDFMVVLFLFLGRRSLSYEPRGHIDQT